MTMSQYRLSLRLHTAAVLLCVAWPYFAQVAFAQGKAEKPAERRWEYCLIKETTSRYKNGSSGEIGYYARICNSRAAGCQMEEVEGTNLEDALMKTIAKLGSDGWEMVGSGAFSLYVQEGHENPERLYFKRPVQ